MTAEQWVNWAGSWNSTLSCEAIFVREAGALHRATERRALSIAAGGRAHGLWATAKLALHLCFHSVKQGSAPNIATPEQSNRACPEHAETTDSGEHQRRQR
jgi:hypothetical protein